MLIIYSPGHISTAFKLIFMKFDIPALISIRNKSKIIIHMTSSLRLLSNLITIFTNENEKLPAF